MDPQKLSQLDPKLREAYQRVMGTSTPKADAPSQAQSPTPTPPSPDPIPQPTIPTPPITPSIPESPTQPAEPPQSIPQPVSDPIPAAQLPQPAINPQPPTIPTPEPIADPQTAMPTSSNFDQMNSAVAGVPAASSPNFSVPQPQTKPLVPAKKKMKILPLLIVLGVIIFIAGYTFFWTQIFKFKLPFLP